MISDPAMVRALNESLPMPIEHPRRIVPPSPPGALLKGASSDQPRMRRSDAGRDSDYLAMLRELPCLKCGVEPCGEAAHVRLASAAYGKASGLQQKPDDKWALPLCGDDHREARDAQHKRREHDFWRDLGINPLIACERLHAQRGDLVAMRAVVLTTIAERGTK